VIFYFGAFSDISISNKELFFSPPRMQRNAFSSEDALSDASMKDRVLNFLKNQRLRFDILYKREKERERDRDRERERGTIIMTKRERTSLFSTAALRERLSRVSRIPIFNFALRSVWQLDETTMQKL